MCLDHYFYAGRYDLSCAKNSGLATQDWSLGIANWVAICVEIILSGFQYKFSSCRGGDENINYDNGDPWFKCWSESRSSRWCENVLVSCSISQIQSRQTYIHRFVHYDNKNWWCVVQSWSRESTWSVNPQSVDPWSAKYRCLKYIANLNKLIRSF